LALTLLWFCERFHATLSRVQLRSAGAIAVEGSWERMLCKRSYSPQPHSERISSDGYDLSRVGFASAELISQQAAPKKYQILLVESSPERLA